MTLKNELNQRPGSCAPPHMWIIQGRMVVIKPRAHRHHMRPVFKKIKAHGHKLRSCIRSYWKLTVLPTFVPNKTNHWRDLFKCSSPHGTSFIKLLTSTTFTTKKKATKKHKHQTPSTQRWCLKMCTCLQAVQAERFQDALRDGFVPDNIISFS